MHFFNSKITGYIPERLLYAARTSAVRKDYWESDIFAGEAAKETFDVRDTYVADFNSEKQVTSARSWAMAGREPNSLTDEQQVYNEPIDEVKIISLEHRGNGGRAWKVLIDDTYCVDLREDVFLDAIRNGNGMVKDMLRGPFRWCYLGNNMKLVRVGSRLYEAALDAHDRRSKPKILASQLVPGTIYADYRGNKLLYMGLVKTSSLQVVEPGYNCYYCGYGSPARNTQPVRVTIDHSKTEEWWVQLRDRCDIKELVTKGTYTVHAPYQHNPEYSYTISLASVSEFAKHKTVRSVVGTVDFELPSLETHRKNGAVRQDSNFINGYTYASFKLATVRAATDQDPNCQAVLDALFGPNHNYKIVNSKS